VSLYRSPIDVGRGLHGERQRLARNGFGDFRAKESLPPCQGDSAELFQQTGREEIDADGTPDYVEGRHGGKR